MVTITSTTYGEDGTATVTTREHPGKLLVLTDDASLPFALVDDTDTDTPEA